MSANQAISDAQRLMSTGNYDEAAKRFQYALDASSPEGASANSYSRAQAGLAAAKAGQAQQLAKDYKFAEAASLLQESIMLEPNNPVYTADIEDLKKQQLAYEAEVRDPEGTVNNPALTSDFRNRVATVQKLLFQGDAYFRTGQFDKSEETYSKILLLDPYNKAARDKMAHIERYKSRADDFRHDAYEASTMEAVANDWSEAVSPDIVAGPAHEGPAPGLSNRAKITHKLESIVIDRVNFEKLDIASVIQFLQQKSKELDPDHEGINFVLRLNTETAPPADATGGEAPPTETAPTGVPPAEGTAPTEGAPAPEGAPPALDAHPIRREVSITLSDVPLSEILGYIVSQTNLQYSVEDYAVYLRPSVDEGETLSVRTFLVPPDFWQGSTLDVTLSPPTDTTTSTVSNVIINVQQQLTDKGIHFPPGATATFLPGSGKLVVRDTPEQLDLVANLIDQQSKEPPQVQIEAKIAEFNQEAIKGLTFNYLFGNSLTSSPLEPPSPTNVSMGASSALRTSNYASTAGNGGILADDIDSLIQQNSSETTFYPIEGSNGPAVAQNTPNQLTIGAVIDGKGFQAVVDAINNMQGVSLISAPSVITQNGLTANIDVVREFPYPTSFERPVLSNNTQLFYPPQAGGGAGIGPLSLAVPPTPSEFVSQDVGVSLEVRPTTYPDQRIDLDITKAQVLDFDGFINYGPPILTRLVEDIPPADEEGAVLTPGVVNQPVFNLRSMVTNLQVLDGQTAVLGGLIREDTQEVNDKVPVLGDLPLVGRLFQSKVSQRTKKNLLFFVTARLVRSNGKPEYVKTLEAEPEEEALPEPEPIGAGVSIPKAQEGTSPEGTPPSS
ncbi:MAG TPA: hypothetical protein VGZ93_10035 [Candidatus Methylacidiphilales bacterium]|nr:hypothetical protein [Candidatus Methylacidiphilales bacterium]